MYSRLLLWAKRKNKKKVKKRKKKKKKDEGKIDKTAHSARIPRKLRNKNELRNH